MIAVDIGGSHITSVQVSDISRGEMKGNLRTSLIQIHTIDKIKVLNTWAENINKTINSIEQFDGHIAIAFPGPMDYQMGIVKHHLNGKFKLLEGENIKDKLFERLNFCKSIHLQNDADCFGIGEYFYGQNIKIKKLLALTLGSGIGSAFIEDGKIIKNRDEVPQGGEVYNIGYRGLCADDYFSTRWFVNQSALYGYEVNGVKQLVDEGSPEIVEKIFAEFSHNFFTFFAFYASNFQADTIVIGGNISKAWRYFGSELKKLFGSIGIQVRQSHLGEKAICLGAAKLVKDKIKK